MQLYIRPLVSDLRSLGPDSFCTLVAQQLEDLKGLVTQLERIEVIYCKSLNLMAVGLRLRFDR